MKEFFLHNRPAAIAALILAILLAFTLGVNRSVGSLARDVEKAYVENDAKYGSVQKDINKFYAYLNELYSVSSSFGEDKGMERALGDLTFSLTSPFINANAVLTSYETANVTYDRLINSDKLTEEQKTETILCFAELQSLKLRLKNNEPYNAAAEKYNSALKAFPANVFDFFHEPAGVFE